MEKRQALPWTSLRGWDVYVAGFVAVIGMYAPTVPPRPPLWMLIVPLLSLAAWYVIAGRRALRTRDPRWAVAYAAGSAVLYVGAAWAEPWTAPLQAVVIPLCWWLFMPNRRRVLLATIGVALACASGLLLFGLFRLNPDTGKLWWDPPTTIIIASLIPAVIITVGVLGSRYLDGVWRWGRERTDLVADLRATEERRIALAREAAVFEERLHLSQEIHDTIAQDLAGLRFLVERARRQIGRIEEQCDAGDGTPPPTEPVGQTIDMIATAVDSVLVETRDLISATSPVPAGSSFKETVERIGHRFAKETDITVGLDVADARLSREAEVVFIRCLQEGLSNVRKHARATRVAIAVTVAADTAVLTLSDDGVGLAPGAAQGFGLPGMTERVRQAGGSFTVDSPGPHRGVVLRVQMPVQSSCAVGSPEPAPTRDQRKAKR